jgi:hypothetical protein
VAAGSLTGQIVKLSHCSDALGEIHDDAHREGIAADAGDQLAQQVGGTVEIVGGRAADYFDVVAFPVHLPACDGAQSRSGYGVEIGDSERKGAIRGDGDP